MKKIELFNLNENNQFKTFNKKINKLITNKNFIKAKKFLNLKNFKIY